MLFKLATRFLKSTEPRLLWKFMYNFGWKGMRAVQAYKKRLKNGQVYPAFLFMSVTNACNLNCQGCWVTQTKPVGNLDFDLMERIIVESKKMKSYFFGILGGEPFLNKDLFPIIERHPECYFQIFTNATLITEESAQRMRELGNITPLVSIEGLEEVSDIRRGGDNVYARTMQGLQHLHGAKLITGVATSVCKSNFDELVSEDFVKRVMDLGVQYLWYYIYRPVGPRPTTELALDEDQILKLREFMVDIRCRVPLIIVDAYWNEKGEALCPGGVGISHHINATGDVEPCPVVQFADENIRDSDDMVSQIANSEFLGDFRSMVCKLTRGCILMDYPDELKKHVETHNVNDTTGRGTGIEELAAMQRVPCHHVPGKEIPEKCWFYKLAKKNWFFGFGAYG